ncbi:hypothetical protein [Luteimonas deserti]|uniref:Uncharacterized protein n=1 Tax=Luteimonas deserti TaxID=2752306 RepID=A0A7Z0QN62_9GAMM|nr:hypothetical protein [Luteimonas deserti]NYZ61674.1 hypothetical protein [Luteimonas deserti]
MRRLRGAPVQWACRLAVLAVALVMMTAGCAMANQQGVDQGDRPGQRFIVKFREGTSEGRDPAAVQPRLDAAMDAIAADRGVRLQWLHRMGIGADVVRASAPVDPAAVDALLAQLSADPDVEYAELDGMMHIGPVPEPPAR